MWLTIWNERMRLTSPCAIAPNTPTSIVAPATHNRSVAGRVSSGNSSVWVRMMAYTPTLVSRPAKIAVTGDGAVG